MKIVALTVSLLVWPETLPIGSVRAGDSVNLRDSAHESLCKHTSCIGTPEKVKEVVSHESANLVLDGQFWEFVSIPWVAATDQATYL
jgi:hypothetical protein